MNVYIASDHAGYELKKKLIKAFADKNLIDLGPDSDKSVDYPDYAHSLCKKVLENNAPGILLCGSGIGMSITANRYKGIRAALAMTPELAKLSRQHNDSNVLVLPARFIEPETAVEICKIWFATAFEAGRHERRVDKIEKQ